MNKIIIGTCVLIVGVVAVFLGRDEENNAIDYAVEGAPASLSLGFNNAEQVVEFDGGTNMVWVAGNKLQFVLRSSDGSIVEIKTLAEGLITLPALARSNDLLAVTWSERVGKVTVVKALVSTDGAASFGEETILGPGSGSSLAISEDQIVAVWHNDADPTKTEILLSRYTASAWDDPIRVDQSSSAPLWAAVTMEKEDIFVTWRDDRNGVYTIWTRRFSDGEWQEEQNLSRSPSGDPDVCTSGEYVAIAHHGKGEIHLLLSNDGGTSFDESLSVGNGYFAHVSCSSSSVALAWESTTGPAQSKNKKVAWAIYSLEGQLLDGGSIDDGDTAATTLHLASDEEQLELLWVKTNGTPLTGSLRHTIIPLD